MRDRHASFQAAQHGAALVVGEIYAAHPFEQHVDVRKNVFGKEGIAFGSVGENGIMRQVEQLCGHVCGRENEIRKPGAQRASGHAVETGAARLLHEHESAVLLDGLDAARAVGTGAGKHHGHGQLVLFFGKRGEKEVYGMIDGAVHLIHEHEPAVSDGHVLSRRNEKHRVGFHAHAVFRLHDAHSGMLAENFGHETPVVRRQMLNHDKTESAVGGHSGKKLLKRLQPAGGSSHAHNDQRGFLFFLHRILQIVIRHEASPRSFASAPRHFFSKSSTDMGRP